MVGKLLKYEFRAMIKQFSILWPLAIAIAVLGSFTNEYFDGLSEVALGIVFGGIMMAMMAVTAVFIIGRYHNGLLKDEGYLMFTLPVTTTELIIAKFICAAITATVSITIGFLAIIIMTSDTTLRYLFERVLKEFFEEMTHEERMLFFRAGGMAFVKLVQSILLVYASISIGHLSLRYRTIISIVAFVVILNVEQIILSLIMDAMHLSGLNIVFFNNDEISAMNDITTVSSVTWAVLAVAYFFISKIILSKKLNLE